MHGIPGIHKGINIVHPRGFSEKMSAPLDVSMCILLSLVEAGQPNHPKGLASQPQVGSIMQKKWRYRGLG